MITKSNSATTLLYPTVQSNSREEDNARHDIEHIRRVMSENQKALTSVVTVLSSIQEEVRGLSIAVHRQQATTFHITAPGAPRPLRGRRGQEGGGPRVGVGRGRRGVGRGFGRRGGRGGGQGSVGAPGEGGGGGGGIGIGITEG